MMVISSYCCLGVGFDVEEEETHGDEGGDGAEGHENARQHGRHNFLKPKL